MMKDTNSESRAYPGLAELEYLRWGCRTEFMFNESPGNSQVLAFFVHRAIPCTGMAWAGWQPPFLGAYVAKLTLIFTSPLHSFTFTRVARPGIYIFNLWLRAFWVLCKLSGFCDEEGPVAAEITDLQTDVSGNLFCLIYFSAEKKNLLEKQQLYYGRWLRFVSWDVGKAYGLFL